VFVGWLAKIDDASFPGWNEPGISSPISLVNSRFVDNPSSHSFRTYAHHPSLVLCKYTFHSTQFLASKVLHIAAMRVTLPVIFALAGFATAQTQTTTATSASASCAAQQ
jgi:hypothetical protein